MVPCFLGHGGSSVHRRNPKYSCGIRLKLHGKGMVSDINPACEKAARGSYSEFLTYMGSSASTVHAFVSSYSLNAGEFLINYCEAGWFQRTPKHLLISSIT